MPAREGAKGAGRTVWGEICNSVHRTSLLRLPWKVDSFHRASAFASGNPNSFDSSSYEYQKNTT
eukprot:5025798-Karenia_brevis.AAC.1